MRYEFRPCTETDRAWAYALKSEVYRDVVERQFGAWDETRQRALFAQRWKPATSRVVLVDGVAVGLLAVEDRTGELWLDEIQIAASGAAEVSEPRSCANSCNKRRSRENHYDSRCSA